jgi:Magnesium chelatase, subunit ChlI
MWRRLRCIPTISPAMTLPEALETTRLHRVVGLTGARTAVVTTRPFRAPHHTISDVGLIGGGQGPLPGDVPRAHHGVLLLDARPECTRHVLEVLRQPLEESLICISSPECHTSLRFYRVSESATDRKPRMSSPIAAYPYCGGPMRRASTTSPHLSAPMPGVPSCFSLDTTPGVEY